MTVTNVHALRGAERADVNPSCGARGEKSGPRTRSAVVASAGS
jgi:hypothetical protein